MTVKELIEELKKYPEDLIVCFDDYESGPLTIDSLDVQLLNKYMKESESNYKILLLLN